MRNAHHHIWENRTFGLIMSATKCRMQRSFLPVWMAGKVFNFPDVLQFYYGESFHEWMAWTLTSSFFMLLCISRVWTDLSPGLSSGLSPQLKLANLPVPLLFGHVPPSLPFSLPDSRCVSSPLSQRWCLRSLVPVISGGAITREMTVLFFSLSSSPSRRPLFSSFSSSRLPSRRATPRST